MTAISILGGDFEVLFDDEFTANAGDSGIRVGMKTVRRATGAASTVYTTNALYSAVADAADDFQAMGFENPMLPVTPNAYTMENDYFIPRSSTEWLKEGAIEANWTLTGANGCIRVTYVESIAFAPGDIGRQVEQTTDGDRGTLLDYEVDPDGTKVLWIRPDTAADTFDGTNGITMVTSGGTGVASSIVAGTSGTTLFSSIQVIGSVPTATEVYLVQDRQKMTNSTGAFQWWNTDPALSLGIIDILIRVQNANVSIADGDVEVFARRYTSLYDNFRLRVAAGGRSALPLASAVDINNTTGDRRDTAQAATGAGTFNVGNHIYVGGTYATATMKGVVTSVAGTSSDPVLQYYLVGDLTDLSNGNTVQEYDPVTGADGDASMTAAAPIVNLTGPSDTASGEGGSVTITLGFNAIDHNSDATNEFYSIEIDAKGNVPIAKVYERLKYVTRRGQDNSFWTTTSTNVPGETYRGLEAIIEYDANVGTMVQGEDVNNDGGTGAEWTARLFAQNTTHTTTYVTVTDQQTSIKSLTDNDLISDSTGTDSVTVNTLTAPDFGIDSITSPKSSPFGTFTGSQIFGARGVAFINPNVGDEQAYILTDDLGNLINPPNTVSFVVNTTAIDDRVMVAKDTGVAGVIDKDQYGGLVAPAVDYNAVGDGKIRLSTIVTNDDIPSSGYIRVVNTKLQEEHKYEYTSRSLADNEFVLSGVGIGDGIADITDAGSDIGDGTITYTYQVTNSTFTSAPAVEVGMVVRCLTATQLDEVWEVYQVTDANNLELIPLYGGMTAITTGEVFEINKLIGDHDINTGPTDYDNTANAYVPLIDAEASATLISNSFVKSTGNNFNTVVNVRQGSVIIPFTTNPTVNDNGGSSTVVRTTDTIAT